MSINVKTENVNDATVQVHIAFENEGYNHRKPKKRRATRTFNRALLRDVEPIDLSTGRNKAEHRSSSKTHRRDQNLIPYAPPSPVRSRPARQSPA